MKVLIWDFDGTLGYRTGAWSGAMLDVLDARLPGHTLTRDDLRRYLLQGFPWHNADQPHTQLTSADLWWANLHPVFQAAYVQNGLPLEQAADCASQVRRFYCHPDAWQLYPDTHAALRLLSQDGWIHVLLSNHVPELEDLLELLGIRHFFAALFNSAIMGYEKPHPAAFRHVLAHMPQYEHIWMIGDNPSAGIAGAAALGIPGSLVCKNEPGVAYCGVDLMEVLSVVK